MYSFMNSMDSLMFQKNGRSRAINQENPTGEKGKGGMAASDLGPSRKGAPCIRAFAPGETRVLAIQKTAGKRGTLAQIEVIQQIINKY